MHVLIIFILIVSLVLCRIQSPRLQEGLDGQTGSTGPTGSTMPTETILKSDQMQSTGPINSVSVLAKEPVPFVQAPLYDGVW